MSGSIGQRGTAVAPDSITNESMYSKIQLLSEKRDASIRSDPTARRLRSEGTQRRRCGILRCPRRSWSVGKDAVPEESPYPEDLEVTPVRLVGSFGNKVGRVVEAVIRSGVI
jgi:hypothetical protein